MTTHPSHELREDPGEPQCIRCGAWKDIPLSLECTMELPEHRATWNKPEPTPMPTAKMIMAIRKYAMVTAHRLTHDEAERVRNDLRAFSVANPQNKSKIDAIQEGHWRIVPQGDGSLVSFMSDHDFREAYDIVHWGN